MHAVEFFVAVRFTPKVSVSHFSLRPKYCKSCGTRHGWHGNHMAFIHVLPRKQGQSLRGHRKSQNRIPELFNSHFTVL